MRQGTWSLLGAVLSLWTAGVPATDRAVARGNGNGRQLQSDGLRRTSRAHDSAVGFVEAGRHDPALVFTGGSWLMSGLPFNKKERGPACPGAREKAMYKRSAALLQASATSVEGYPVEKSLAGFFLKRPFKDSAVRRRRQCRLQCQQPGH